jgi:hypothetical protein
MNELETALKDHDWTLESWQARVELDQLIKAADPGAAKSLWENYCPWSDANGGYINWIKN